MMDKADLIGCVLLCLFAFSAFGIMTISIYRGRKDDRFGMGVLIAFTATFAIAALVGLIVSLLVGFGFGGSL